MFVKNIRNLASLPSKILKILSETLSGETMILNSDVNIGGVKVTKQAKEKRRSMRHPPISVNLRDTENIK